jgi:gas vesicle protein
MRRVSVEKATKHASTQGPAKGNGLAWFKGLLVGAAAGAAAAILIAPRSGEETQAELRRRSQELKEQTEQRADKLRLRAGEGVRDARLAVADWLETQAGQLRSLEPDQRILAE